MGGRYRLSGKGGCKIEYLGGGKDLYRSLPQVIYQNICHVELILYIFKALN